MYGFKYIQLFLINNKPISKIICHHSLMANIYEGIKFK